MQRRCLGLCFLARLHRRRRPEVHLPQLGWFGLEHLRVVEQRRGASGLWHAGRLPLLCGGRVVVLGVRLLRLFADVGHDAVGGRGDVPLEAEQTGQEPAAGAAGSAANGRSGGAAGEVGIGLCFTHRFG